MLVYPIAYLWLKRYNKNILKFLFLNKIFFSLTKRTSHNNRLAAAPPVKIIRRLGLRHICLLSRFLLSQKIVPILNSPQADYLKTGKRQLPLTLSVILGSGE